MFKLEFETDNAAFGETPLEQRPEIIRILTDIVTRVARGDVDGTVRDVNGNRIGSWSRT